jgi:hypothetical protein
MFPRGTVDRYGLTAIGDYAIPPEDRPALAAIEKREFDKAMELARKRITDDEEDLVAYVLFVQAANLSGNAKRAVDGLRDIRLAGAKFESTTQTWKYAIPSRSHQIADSYARIVMASHQPGSGVQGAPRLNASIIAGKPGGRLDAMLVTSIVWWHGDLKDARAVADKYLRDDPEFFQLRVFYAHLWGRGQGPRRYGNGAIDYSAQVDGDPAVVMKHANIVIKSHPEYAPAYFVARLSTDKSQVKRNLTRFLQGCHPASEWYKQAKERLARITDSAR